MPKFNITMTLTGTYEWTVEADTEEEAELLMVDTDLYLEDIDYWDTKAHIEMEEQQ